MKLTNEQRDNLSQLAKSQIGLMLVEYLELIKREVCDVRNDLAIKSDIDKEVRIATCSVIDKYLVDELKVRMGVTEKPNDDWH